MTEHARANAFTDLGTERKTYTCDGSGVVAALGFIRDEDRGRGSVGQTVRPYDWRAERVCGRATQPNLRSDGNCSRT